MYTVLCQYNRYLFVGNETVVDLYLYDTAEEEISLSTNQDATFSCYLKPKVESEEYNAVEQTTSTCEHDYCFSEQNVKVNNNGIVIKEEFEGSVNIKQEEDANPVHLDHSYYRIDMSGNETDSCSENDTSNSLIHGVTQDDNEANTLEEIICDFKIDDQTDASPQLNSKSKHLYTGNSNNILQVLTEDGKIIILSKHKPQQLIKPVTETVQIPLSNKYQINFPTKRFKNVLEALPFLFKRLPLVTKFASDTDYTALYPYVAHSIEEFSSWHVGKQLSCEVSFFMCTYFLKNVLDQGRQLFVLAYGVLATSRMS